jgi:hypothetical protein
MARVGASGCRFIATGGIPAQERVAGQTVPGIAGFATTLSSLGGANRLRRRDLDTLRFQMARGVIFGSPTA